MGRAQNCGNITVHSISYIFLNFFDHFNIFFRIEVRDLEIQIPEVETCLGTKFGPNPTTCCRFHGIF